MTGTGPQTGFCRLLRASQTFARWEVERTARAYGVKPRFFPGGHDLMLDPAGTEMMDALLTWLAEQGLGLPVATVVE